MNMRSWIVLGVVAVLGLLALPVLAQPYMTPGPGHMGGPQQPSGQPISITQAETIARQALDRSGFAGLVPGHIMEFSNHFYVAVMYKVGGQGVFELLVDRHTGAVHPEPQSMMWNTQFGHMAGWSGLTPGTMGPGMMNPGGTGSMMGPGGGSTMTGPGGSGGGMMGPGGSTIMGGGMGPGLMGQISGPTMTPSVTAAQAEDLAQKYLNARLPGAKVDNSISFPGYYTFDFAKDGKVIGMLSVNAYTGQIWHHAWHGTFVQEKDLE
jgi:hypothetical protein